MSTASVIVLVILALIILFGIVAPFLLKQADQRFPEEESFLFEQGKEEIFAQLSDLEYDHHMKKITENDYNHMKVELTEKAAAFMNDSFTGTELIEKEV